MEVLSCWAVSSHEAHQDLLRAEHKKPNRDPRVEGVWNFRACSDCQNFGKMIKLSKF